MHPAQNYGQGLCFSIHIHYIRSDFFDIKDLSLHSLPVAKCGGFFYLCTNKSDKEYGTSKPPTTLHYL